jgi:hypothetical protein
VSSIAVTTKAFVLETGVAMGDLLAGGHPLPNLFHSGRVPYFLQAVRLCVEPAALVVVNGLVRLGKVAPPSGYKFK